MACIENNAKEWEKLSRQYFLGEIQDETITVTVGSSEENSDITCLHVTVILMAKRTKKIFCIKIRLTTSAVFGIRQTVALLSKLVNRKMKLIRSHICCYIICDWKC